MAQVEARPDAEQLTDANALRGVYRAVALVALAVLCMVVPRVLAAAFFDGEYDQHPPPILTRELAVWLALCPLAVIAGFRARPLIRDKVMASGAVLIALTALLAFFWGMAEAVFLAAVFCIGVLFPRDARVTPSLAADVASTMVLLTAVAGAWLLLAFYLAIGAIVFPTGASDQYTQYEGIEPCTVPAGGGRRVRVPTPSRRPASVAAAGRGGGAGGADRPRWVVVEPAGGAALGRALASGNPDRRHRLCGRGPLSPPHGNDGWRGRRASARAWSPLLGFARSPSHPRARE